MAITDLVELNEQLAPDSRYLFVQDGDTTVIVHEVGFMDAPRRQSVAIASKDSRVIQTWLNAKLGKKQDA